MLQKLQDTNLLRRLRLSLDRTPEDTFPGMQQEIAVCQLMLDYSTEVASRYVWAHLPFTLNMPQSFAVFLLEEPDERKEAVGYLKEMLAPLYRAELRWKECLKTDHDKAGALARVFAHIGFCHHQLARELLAFMLQCNFCPDDLQCRKVCAKLFRGSSTTKHCLEDVFSHLQRMASRATTNKRMSHWARYMYATTARSVQTGGMNTILPDEQDWEACSRQVTRELHDLAQMFDMNTTNLPEPENEDSVLFPRPQQAAEKKWKAAGPESNQRGAAAVAYLRADEPADWSNINHVWAGWRLGKLVFLLELSLFREPRMHESVRMFAHEAESLQAFRNQLLLPPFGFYGYAAAGLCLTEVCAGDKARCL